MKKNIDQLVLRLLAGSIDVIIVLVSVFFISLYVFQFSFKVSELYAQFAFLIYNILFVDLLKGQTLGKKIAHMYVVFEEGEKAPLIKKGIREVTKLLYFLPMVGIIFCMGSCIIFLYKGKFLHDFVGSSTIVLGKDFIKEVD